MKENVFFFRGRVIGINRGRSPPRSPLDAQESLPQSDEGVTSCGRFFFWLIGEVSSNTSDVASCVPLKDGT